MILAIICQKCNKITVMVSSQPNASAVQEKLFQLLDFVAV